ncbi:hypothetical protein [Kitasatospora sp. NPDC002040]|uniref:hypothetical protein n=1 Tax=Kitasatospora sp. NPDC002040 TaxID=3154661 RepID=UPI0033223675
MSYDEIIMADAARPPTTTGLVPTHAMTFVSPIHDDRDLVAYDITGVLPVPAVGQIVTLHDTEVLTLRVATTYTSDESTGRPRIHTLVTVRTLEPGEKPTDL